MTKTAILVLTLYCGAQFFSTFLGALMVGMTATTNAELPNWTAIVFAVFTGLMAPINTLLPILKALLVDFGVKMNGEASAVVKAVAKI